MGLPEDKITCQLLLSLCLFHSLLFFSGCLSDTEIFPHWPLQRASVDLAEVFGTKWKYLFAYHQKHFPGTPCRWSETAISGYLYFIRHDKFKVWLRQWFEDGAGLKQTGSDVPDTWRLCLGALACPPGWRQALVAVAGSPKRLQAPQRISNLAMAQR